jgi:acetoin utilization deacetylase AcuC-like enzyme
VRTQLIFDFHQVPLYPGTGLLEEIGEDAGEGYKFNVTMMPGSGDPQYLAVMDEIFLPVVQQFKPNIILVSAGFDGHFSDPIAELKLTTQGFGQIIQRAKTAANQFCDGRIIILLEGGYNLSAVSRGVLQEVSVLANLGIELKDPPPKIDSEAESFSRKLIGQIKDLFSPYWKF